MFDVAELHVIRETAGDKSRSLAEFIEVGRNLQPYIWVVKSGEGPLIRISFFDHTDIAGSMDGEVCERDADAFDKVVTRQDLSSEIQHHIVWMPGLFALPLSAIGLLIAG